MYNRKQWLRVNGGEVQSGVNGIVHLANDGDVVPSDDVQSQDDLFDPVGGREDALVGVVQDHVNRLVEAFQGAHEVPAVCRDYRDRVVHVRVQAGCHCGSGGESDWRIGLRLET